MMFLLRLVVLVMSLAVSVVSAGGGGKTVVVVEPKTGLEFPITMMNKRQKLQKLGVRTKGPLKLYAVGQYGKDNHGNDGSLFVLQMKMGVSAEKISGALADALRPRCLQHSSSKEESLCEDKIGLFKDLILDGLPGRSGAAKGTTLAFATSGGKIAVTINGKSIGSVSSKPLAKSFAGIYTDKNAVCTLHPAMVDGSSDSGTGTGGFPFDLLDSDDPMRFATLVVGLLTVLYVLKSIAGLHSSKAGSNNSIAVCELNVYPIKSCAEQRVSSAVVTPSGFVGDRMAMVVNHQGVCCTPRTLSHAKLFKLTPQYNNQTKNILIGVSGRSILASIQVDTTAQSNKPKADIRHNEAPGTLTLDDYGDDVANWLTKHTGIPGARLTGINTSTYARNAIINPAQGDAVPVKGAPVSLADEAPFLLCNEASLADLNRRLQQRGKNTVDMRRFRPNVVVQGGSLKAWEEDTWHKVRIGPRVEFFVWQRCGRCTMTTIDRDSLDRCGEPLSTLSTFRERKHGMRNFGMHLIPDPKTLNATNPQMDNVISEHDTVTVLEYNHERLKEWEAAAKSSS